jgi:predicted transcriptional regulator YdeE
MPSRRFETRDRFWVAGVQLTTTNEAESNPVTAQIPGAWQRFHKERVAERVQDRLDDGIVAVYHDYESDHTGAYDVTIGIPVRSLDGQPADLAFVRVPSQRYTVFTSERGRIPEVVISTWRQVWAASEEDLGGRRAFEADFEHYSGEASASEGAQVEVWVGLSP